jgi:hypothetical protein
VAFLYSTNAFCLFIYTTDVLQQDNIATTETHYHLNVAARAGRVQYTRREVFGGLINNFGIYIGSFPECQLFNNI